MARIRSVKPEYWTSEQVMDLSRDARLLFIGLWNFCDDAGIHPASPKRLKAEVFPADDVTSADVRRMVDEMIQVGLVEEYEVDGESFWTVTGWHHQKIDQPTFKHPRPDGTVPAGAAKRRKSRMESSNSPSSSGMLAEASPDVRRTLAECSPPESSRVESKGEEGKGDINPSQSSQLNPTEVGAVENERPSGPRSVQIAVLLRSAGVKPLTSMHPVAIEWGGNAAVTDAILQAAVESARQYKPDGDISPNYLKPIVEQLLNPPEPRAAKPQQDQWWLNNAGIERKGKEIGLMPRPTEGYGDFKDRIFEKLRATAGGKAA